MRGAAIRHRPVVHDEERQIPTAWWGKNKTDAIVSVGLELSSRQAKTPQTPGLNGKNSISSYKSEERSDEHLFRIRAKPEFKIGEKIYQ